MVNWNSRHFISTVKKMNTSITLSRTSMIMKHLSICISISCLLFLFGCSSVVSKHPIGIEKYNASADALNGTWLSDEEFIKIKIMDEPNGILKLIWIEEKDNDFKLESITCQIMKGGKDLYLTVLEMPDEGIAGFYYWGKVEIENRKILFWLPSFDAFKEAYEANKIKAILDKTKADKSGKQKIENIKLIDDPKIIVELIKDNNWKYFDFENPIVLIKLMK